MNSPKSREQHPDDLFDLAMRHNLKNWAAKHTPPENLRTQLLEKAAAPTLTSWWDSVTRLFRLIVPSLRLGRGSSFGVFQQRQFQFNNEFPQSITQSLWVEQYRFRHVAL